MKIQTPRNKNIFLTFLIVACGLLISACAQYERASLPDVDNLTADQYRSPPPASYFKIKESAVPEIFLQNINVTNAHLSLREAIHATLPFKVVVQPLDAAIDFDKLYQIRVDNNMRVLDFINYLEGITNYKISLDPNNQTLKLASYTTKSWNLAAVASASRNQITFGSDTDETDSEDDENTSSDSDTSSVEFKSELSYGDLSPWEILLNQAHCIMRTSDCERESGADEVSRQAGTAQDVWVQADQRTGLLTASGPVQSIRRLNSWLTPLAERTSRMVQLEVAILDVTSNQAKAKLLNILLLNNGDRGGLVGGSESNRLLTAGGWVIDADFSISGNNLDILLNQFTEDQDVKILHRTNLITANGGMARINSIEKFFYAGGQDVIPGDLTNQQIVTSSLEEAQVGLELTITPQFMPDNTILLTVVPELSSLVRFDDIVSGGTTVSRAPRISLTNLLSKGITRSGRAIPVAQLTSKQFNDRISTPFGLDNKTAVGDFFSTKNLSDNLREIIVVVLPREIVA